MFCALDPPGSNDAKNRHCTTPAPPSPAARQPPRLLPHPQEVTIVVGPGLRLDRERNATRRDRHRVDVSAPPPVQRMPHPPPVPLKDGKRPPHLVFRPGPDPASSSETEPMARVEAEPDSGEEKQRGHRHRANAHEHEGEQRGAGAARRRSSGARESAVLLAARVVQAASSSIASASANGGLLTTWAITIRELLRCSSCRVQQPSRLLPGRQQRRLADRFARCRSLPPVALSATPGEPFPLPSTSGTLRAPLLPHHLDGASRRLEHQRLGSVCNSSTGHQPSSSRPARSCWTPSSGSRHTGAGSSSDVLTARGRFAAGSLARGRETFSSRRRDFARPIQYLATARQSPRLSSCGSPKNSHRPPQAPDLGQAADS